MKMSKWTAPVMVVNITVFLYGMFWKAMFTETYKLCHSLSVVAFISNAFKYFYGTFLTRL
jgi:hypothetical protein